MRLDRIGRGAVCLLFFWAVCAGLLPTPVRAADEKVRVGVYEKEDYHTIDANGRHAGYDHEYLNKIAYYTGWEYEYVSGTWESCMEMLKAGEIDLMGGVEQNEERKAYLHFPVISTMSATGVLIQKEGSSKYAFEEYESFDGMRVGLLKGSNQVNTFQTFSREKGFTYEPVMFESEVEMQKALAAGQVDCLYMDSCRDLGKFSVLCYYGYTPLYYVTNQNRQDLSRELDLALEKIRIQEPEFEYNLYSKYFEYAQNISLSREEQEYVQNSEPILVGLNTRVSSLLCRWDGKTDSYTGLMPDTLRLLSQRTGLNFEFTVIPDEQSLNAFLSENPNSIVAPAMKSSLINYDRGFLLLEPIYKGKMLTITRSGHNVDTESPFVLALPKRLYQQEDEIKNLFPQAQRIPGGSHKECMELVASGKADMALVNEFTASYEMKSPFFENLQSANLSDITEDLTLAVSYEADYRLVSTLSKGILSLSERDTRDIVLNNTAAGSYEFSLDEFLYNARHTVFLTIVILMGGIFFANERKLHLEKRRRDEQYLERVQDRLAADQEYQKIILHQANYDDLTGLYNQKYFIEQANERMDAHPEQTYRFLWINLRGFRMINDLYGMEAGDAILLNMAECMRKCIGPRGVYGRMYADRFAVCIPQDCEINFMDQCVRHVEFNGKILKAHVCIGVYVDDQHCRDAARCINYALIALQNGDMKDSSPMFFFNTDQLDAMRTRQWITNDMDRALQEEQFQLYLQPQYDIDGKTLVGAEALSRWEHPEHGMISPAVYIPIFESNNFIHQLSAYMCDHVCRLVAQWLENGKAVPVSINLSQIDLEDPQLIPMIQGTLEKYNLPVQYLNLEITESAYADNQEQAAAIIDKLRSLGFLLEMDDFGSGYSSLNMLKNVTVDTVKLDFRFLSKGANVQRARRIIDFVVQMAHSIGMNVMAEGVETEEDAAFLASIGCNSVQGYLYGRPMPVEEFNERLASSVIGSKITPCHNTNPG